MSRRPDCERLGFEQRSLWPGTQARGPCQPVREWVPALLKQSPMAERRDLGGRQRVAREQRGQHQVDDVGSRRAEASGCRDHGDLARITKSNSRLPGSTGARKLSTRHPTLDIARPTTSSGPAGATVDATRMAVGRALRRCSKHRATAISSSIVERTKDALTPIRSRRVLIIPSKSCRPRSR